MHFFTFIPFFLPVLATALPQGATTTCTDETWVTITTTLSTPISTPVPAGPGKFEVMALRSTSPIHFRSMNAANSSFFLGFNLTNSACPTNIANPCPPGKDTVFSGLGALWDMIPGGQYTYITPGGRVGFTQAHDPIFPEGALTSPFTWSEPANEPFGILSTSAFGATGFMACKNDAGNWQVYASMQNATLESGTVADCLGFDAAATAYNGPVPAWQYV